MQQVKLIPLTVLTTLMLHVGVAVWTCPPGGPEYPDYSCGSGARSTHFLGIFINTDHATKSKSIGQLNTGVRPLRRQTINFARLQTEVAKHFDGSARTIHGDPRNLKTEDVREFKSEEAKIEIPGSTALIVVQIRAECAVRNFTIVEKEEWNNQGYLTFPNGMGGRPRYEERREKQMVPHKVWQEFAGGLMLYSSPLIFTRINLSDCTDREFPSLTEAMPNTNYPTDEAVPYSEGVWFDGLQDTDAERDSSSQEWAKSPKPKLPSWLDQEPDPQNKTSPLARNDDTKQLLEWLTAQIKLLNPSPSSGLSWDKHPISFPRLGRVKKEFKFQVPLNRWTRAFQAVFSCGALRVYGWPFRTLYTDAYGARMKESGKDCKTPEIQPVCMTVEDGRPGTPATFLYNSNCQDIFTKPEQRGDSDDDRKVTFSLEGPFVDKIDDNFKKVFLDKVHAMGASGRTGFDWSTMPSLNLYAPDKNETKIKVAANQVALQLEVQCGEYKLRTDKVAIVEKNEHGDCAKVAGIALTCPQIEAWIF